MKFEYLAWEWFENKKKYIKESTSAYYIFELQNYILNSAKNYNEANDFRLNLP